MFRRTVLLFIVAAVAALPVHARAENAPGVAAVLAQIENLDPSLETYRARVEFSVGLHSFPYVKKTVHGETFFKRPDRMEIVFEDLPAYASHFKNVFVGLGTPHDWQRKFEISLVPHGSEPGASTELLLVPKAAGGRLRSIRVLLDSALMLPVKMLWTYHDGQIALTQSYVHVEGHTVLAAQSAEARFTLWRGFARTRLSKYAFNVPIDDAVFTKKEIAAAENLKPDRAP